MKIPIKATIVRGALLLTLVPLLAFGPGDRIAPTRWAVVVGISDYIHLEPGEGGDLVGAEYDARRVRDVLVMAHDFPEENVLMLVNQEATKAAIQEAITEWLVDKARPGDNVVIWYSGHGSQKWDEDGDEDDGLDETLAPADVLPQDTRNDISDDEFNRWLGMLPTENVAVLLDNCNSGTGTRDVTPFAAGRLLARDLSQIEPPAGVTRRAVGAVSEDRTGFDATQTRVLELSAAQPSQVAVDAFFPAVDGREEFHGGAFTTFMVQQLWKASGDVTYEDVFDQAHEALKRNRFQQDPYISEDVSLRGLPLFFVEGSADRGGEMRLPISAVEGSSVELGAGLALGLTPGSLFETDEGARLRVDYVGQRTTRASVLSGNVSEGDRARLVAHVFADSPLLVNVAAIETRLADALGSALSGAPSVRLIDQEASFSHLIVRRRGEELRVIGSDGYARHEGIPVTTDAMAELAALLTKESAAKTLGDMENPAQSFGLSLEFMGGKTSFGLGEEIAFRIESERDGYLTLVDLGTDGTVAVLIPNAEDPSVRITAGEVFAYPGGDVAFQALPPAGAGLVRAFLTDRPLEIDIPDGEVYAAGGADFAAELTEALAAAAGMDGSAIQLGTWGTASITYDITN